MGRAIRSSPNSRPPGAVRPCNRRQRPHKMQQSDFVFVNDIRAASELRTPRTSQMLLVSVIALIAAGLAWAHFAVLDEVKRGNGRVVSSRQTQVLQSLEGGIVREILVHEGAIVKQGEILMKIDDTRFSA